MACPGEAAVALRSGVDQVASARKLRRTCLVALGLLAVALACGARRAFLEQQRLRLGGEGTVTLASSHFCTKYPHLELSPDAVLYSNLGGRGPDRGQGTGIVYRATLTSDGEKDREVLMMVNTTHSDSHYHPFLSKLNGMQGKFGSINLMSGSSLDLAFTFYDHTSRERLLLPRLMFTFFDLDTGLHGMSRESITLSGFTRYYTTLMSEVRTSREAGETTFSATKYGNAKDNPKDPMALTSLQKNRAVSVTYHDVEVLNVRLAAASGKGPRFFTFVAFPSLHCAATKQSGHPSAESEEVRIVDHEVASAVPLAPARVLPELQAEGPLQVAVKVEASGRFSRWKVRKGAEVSKGDELFVLEGSDEHDAAKRVFRAPVDGSVAAMADLKAGDDLRTRLRGRTVLVIEKSSTGTVTETTTTTGPTAEAHTLSRNDTTTSQTTTLSPIPTLGPISANHCRAAIASPGSRFVEYKARVGDTVKAGQVIVVTKDAATGSLENLTSKVAGKVTAIVTELQPGDPISRVEDGNLVVVEKHVLAPGEKLPPLSVSGNRMDPTEFPKECGRFVEYTVEVGDVVETGDVIATTRARWGWVLMPVTAKRPGVVNGIQDGLEKDMNLTVVMPDRNLATLAPLPRLPATAEDDAALVPADGGWVFHKWMAEVGDVVSAGQPVAQLRGMSGEGENHVLAPRDGMVLLRQEHLHVGDEVGRVLEFLDLLTIGKIREPKLGRAETAVKAPYIHDIFNFFYVRDGDHVNEGEPFAQVTIPTRSLLEGAQHHASIEGSAVTVTSPVSGVVSHLVPLKPGVSIFEQSRSTTIATVRRKLLWFYPLLGVLSAMTFCLLPCFKLAMNKPEPQYLPMSEARKADNVRLLFDDHNGSMMTVFAKYRPLGIKRDQQGFVIGAYAKMGLGVEEGWTLVKVGDEDLSNSRNPEEFWETLEGALEHLPLWPLEMEFQPPEKEAEPQVVMFQERPIGIELMERTYIHVDRVQDGSPAQATGVEAEWILRRVGDFILQEGCTLSEARAALDEGASHLLRRPR